jgi:hypothetical protein
LRPPPASSPRPPITWIFPSITATPMEAAVDGKNRAVTSRELSSAQSSVIHRKVPRTNLTRHPDACPCKLDSMAETSRVASTEKRLQPGRTSQSPHGARCFWRWPRDKVPLRAAQPSGFARAHRCSAATRFCGLLRSRGRDRNAVEADLQSMPRALLTFAA